MAALLRAGSALRVSAMLVAPPALLGYTDSYCYIRAAAEGLFSDPGQPAPLAAAAGIGVASVRARLTRSLALRT